MAGIAEQIADNFEQPLLNFVDEGVTAVSASVAGPFAVLTTLYVLIVGIFIMFGYVAKPLSDFVMLVFKLAIINVLLQNAGFTTYVTDIFFTAIPDGLGTILVNASNSGINAAALQSGTPFDAIIGQANALYAEIYDSAGRFGVGQKMFGAFLMAWVAFVSIIMFGIIIYAKIALALILAIGPVFIALALFETTRQFTQSWVGALANFTILQVLIYALLGLLMSFIQNFMNTPTEGVDSLVKGVNVLAMMSLALVTAALLPGIASALAGSGFALAAKGLGLVTGPQRWAGGKAKQVAKSTAARGYNAARDALTRSRNSASPR